MKIVSCGNIVKETMNRNNSFNTHLSILQGGNWERWSVVLKTQFWAHDLIEIMQNGNEELGTNATKPQRNVHKDLNKKDCQALFLFNKALMVVTLRKSQRLQMQRNCWTFLRTTMKVMKR